MKVSFAKVEKKYGGKTVNQSALEAIYQIIKTCFEFGMCEAEIPTGCLLKTEFLCVGETSTTVSVFGFVEEE